MALGGLKLQCIRNCHVFYFLFLCLILNWTLGGRGEDAHQMYTKDSAVGGALLFTQAARLPQYPSSNFYRGGGSKSAKFGLDFRHYSLLSHPRCGAKYLKCETNLVSANICPTKFGEVRITHP